MPTVVTKVVRYTGGDYTTLAAALAAVPANLVTADQQWDILIAESAAGNYEWDLGGYGPSVSGITTDATRFVRIKPYTGLGFSDRSYSGPANYDPVKGIALKASNVVLSVQSQYTVIEGLQFKQTSTSFLYSGERTVVNNASGSSSTIKNCVITSELDGVTTSRELIYWFASTMINCLLVSKGCNGVSGATTIINSTIINVGANSARTGIVAPYSNPLVKNCAIFGFDTLFDAGGGVTGFTASSNNNATNVASGSTPTNWGSNSLSGLVTAEQFATISTTTNTGNFRLRKSSPLVRGGARDVAYTNDVDIVYRSRSLTLPSIGAWEEPSAVGTVFPANIRFPIRDVNGRPTSTSVDMGDMFLRKDQYLTAGLWSWGWNQYGQLGSGNTTNQSSPVQVGTLTTWRQVSFSYYHSLAIKVDGTLWGFGDDTYGESSGNDVVTSYSSPVQVGSLTNWRQVSAGANYYSVGIKTDGTLWSWGRNNLGQLGRSPGTKSPVQVGALTDWRQVSAGHNHCLAIKTDGTLWAWGQNDGGQLGIGNIDNYSSPVQVGTATDWLQVSSGSDLTAAIKTNGTLWAWGKNDTGQLGLGNTANYSSPVQIGTATNWRQISAGYQHCAAIKTDGTLWVWGRNLEGQIGNNTSGAYSTPVQIGSLTNWRQVAAGQVHTVATKTDGTLWSWGSNGFGQLGRTTGNVLSPVQVGTLTAWKSVSAGAYTTAAIQSPDLP